MVIEDQSVEEWASSVDFQRPLQLGEVEAGILARKPVRISTEWWWPFVVMLSWAAFALVYVLGRGLASVGFVLVLLATREDQAARDVWMELSRLVFVCSTAIEAYLLFEVWKSREREPFGLPTPAMVAAASAGAFALLVNSSVPQPWGLTAAVVATGLLSAMLLVVSAFLQPAYARASRKPPRRGPRNPRSASRYKATRERVLDILIGRGLVEERERRRLLDIPFGYWEELDGADADERRRILDYGRKGWREFDRRDRHWSPSADPGPR